MHAPAPRGPLSSALLTALRRPPGPVPDVPRRGRRCVAASPRRPRGRRRPARALRHVRAALSRRRRRRRGMGVAAGPACGARRPRAGVRVRGPRARATCLTRRPGRRRRSPRRSSISRRADDGPSLSEHIAKRATDAQAPRVRHPSVDLPPQGGGPAHLGAPAADRAGEVGAGRDPGRRVRRRAARSACTPSSSRGPCVAAGLDDTYGAYLDTVPAAVLASRT